MMDLGFWRNRRVLITGHTGFKGGWLVVLLRLLGARVVGYALEPPSTPSLFVAANIADGIMSYFGDVRDLPRLESVLLDTRPEVVIHMAAQPLVLASYLDPIETYSVNVVGTVTVFEALRRVKGTRAVINVTSDKCYENREWIWGYRESEPMGGYDPYSSSKSCAELVTSAFRNSYFGAQTFEDHGVALASARAGNVIGGGDWGADRLVPDIIRSIMTGHPALIRNPHAIRPWQHVLEPLSGYLMLAHRLLTDGPSYAEGWNFGPNDEDTRTVASVTERLTKLWSEGACWKSDESDRPHEATHLKLDCSKARSRLGWAPRWNLEAALCETVNWYRAYGRGENVREIMTSQIERYLSDESITPV